MKGVVIFVCAAVTCCLGYNIDTCNNDKKLQVDETRDTVLTCSGITHDVMVWRLRHTDGTESQIGTCNKMNGQCSGNNVYYTLTRGQGSSTSRLTVRQDHRNKIAGTVQCAGLVGGETVNTTSCDIRVVYTGYSVDNCSTSVSTTTTSWPVSGSCEVDKIYASDGQYSCQWRFLPPTGAQRLFDGQKRMVPFTAGGKDYHRMICSFTDQPLPAGDGTRSYNLRIDPRENPARVYSGPSLVISSAKGPPTLQNCPDYVIEGDDVNCTCLASASKPPAVVTWSTSVSQVVSQRTTLLLPKVPKSVDGFNYTCNQYWGGFSTGHGKTAVYPINVRYPPPSAPVISGVTSYTAGDSLQLTCTVTGGKPPVTNVTFSCGTLSDGKVTTSSSSGQPGMVSTITISSLTDRDHGSACLCSATWSDRPRLYAATSTVTVTVQGLTTTSSDVGSTAASVTSASPDGKTGPSTHGMDGDGGDDSLPFIAGGAAGGAVVIIIVVVIVVILIRRRRGKERSIDDSRNKPNNGDEDFEEHTMYESADDFPPTQAKPSAVALRISHDSIPSSQQNTTPLASAEETDASYTSVSPQYLRSSAQNGIHPISNNPHPDIELNTHSSADRIDASPAPNLDTDFYSSVDGDTDNPSFAISAGPEPQDAGGAYAVNKRNSETKPAPENNEYAVVNKLRKSSNQNPKVAVRGGGGEDSEENVYTQVNKKAKGGKAESRPQEEEPASNAQAQKPKVTSKPVPAVKPKPAVAAKPSVPVKPRQPGAGGGTDNPRQWKPPMSSGYEDVDLQNQEETPADDLEDEYNTLAFNRPPTTAPPENDDPQYSHIGAI